jgi:outer membrane murein-binding lipoprotein Lpp
MTNWTRLYTVLLCGTLALAGCTEHATEQDKAEAAQAAAQKQELADEAVAARKGVHAAESQLAQLPPPAKGRYLQVHSIEGWNNPFLMVGRRTIKLRVVDAEPGDTLPNNVLPDEKLRVLAGNKRELTVRLIDLPEALAALPESSWEYGRVVAVDEDPSVPRRERPQMRRNVEAVIALLNDLDVVVNEWSSR